MNTKADAHSDLCDPHEPPLIGVVANVESGAEAIDVYLATTDMRRVQPAEASVLVLEHVGPDRVDLLISDGHARWRITIPKGPAVQAASASLRNAAGVGVGSVVIRVHAPRDLGRLTLLCLADSDDFLSEADRALGAEVGETLALRSALSMLLSGELVVGEHSRYVETFHRHENMKRL